MAAAHTPHSLSLSDLATTSALPESGGDVVVSVPDGYLNDEQFARPGVEGLAIQRLITLAHEAVSVQFVWSKAAASRVLPSLSVHPLAAVAICLKNAVHRIDGDLDASTEFVERARASVLGGRLAADMFSERQVLLCIDVQRPSLPFDLYDPSTRRLRPESDFESLIDDLVFAQQGAGFKAQKLSRLRLAVAVIVRELLENTDDHAKTDFDGKVLAPNSIRGLLIKRILETRRHPTRDSSAASPIPCLEFTIFDSGIGYYDSYRRQLLRGQARGEPVTVGDRQTATIRNFPLGPDVPPDVEYAIVLKCLGRHEEKAIPDPRPGHRGLGLYEVLRALKEMQGMLEVRTGRVHGYRSFLDGELRVQLEPQTSDTRPGMPRASLLDVGHKLLTRPAPRDMVRGTVVRVVVPLA